MHHYELNNIIYIGPETLPTILSSSASSTTITLTWRPPNKPNGLLVGYRYNLVYYEVITRNPPTSLYLFGSQTTITLSGLQPYTNYQFYIIAYNRESGGIANTIVATKQDSEQ